MDIEQRAKTLTTTYIHSYNLALQEVRNPNLAAQIATAVTMVINTNIPEQPAINPLAAFFAQLAEQQGKEQEQEPGEKSRSRSLGKRRKTVMTEQKMQQINAWLKRINKGKLEMQEKMAIANATMEMLEKLEPIYDKYNGEKKA